MSILIKGMAMPKNEELIIICSNGTVEMTNNDGSRVCEQKAIELPPHGDLIDRDAFDERIRIAGGLADEELSDDFKDGIQTTLLMLKTQRTIIESEGEDG